VVDRRSREWHLTSFMTFFLLWWLLARDFLSFCRTQRFGHLGHGVCGLRSSWLMDMAGGKFRTLLCAGWLGGHSRVGQGCGCSMQLAALPCPVGVLCGDLGCREGLWDGWGCADLTVVEGGVVTNTWVSLYQY
jgi:hypothetical protein